MKVHNKSIKHIVIDVFICAIYLFIPLSYSYGFGKSSLKNKDVVGLEIIYNEESIVIPGSTFQFGVKVKFENEEDAFTRGFTQGKINWNNFTVNVIGGSYSWGEIHIASDDYMVRSGEVIVNVKSKYHKNLSTTKAIKLNKEKNVSIVLEEDFCKAPGEKIKFGILSEFDNGITTSTKGWLRGDFDLDHYMVNCSGCYIKNKKLFITDDIHKISNHTISLEVTPRSNPELTKVMSIVLDYKKRYSFYGSGTSGMGGFGGFDGSNGTTGKHGEDGDNGDHGRHGGRGPDMYVYADAYFDSLLHTDLLYVYVENMDNGKNKEYLVNPRGGSILITSDGGNGGNGGAAGDGGDGGKGSDGEKRVEKIQVNDSTVVEKEYFTRGQDGGYGGNGGFGGCGGDGGNGGDIHINLTPRAEKYTHIIQVYSRPGEGGIGGRGGDGGSGGKGGDGDPDGNPGANGYHGSNGNRGWDGRQGNVFYYQVDEREF